MTILKRFTRLSLLLTGLVSLPALAQNNFDLDDLDDGQLILNLSASEQTEVDQDTLNASLEFIIQDRDQATAQNQVNEAVTAALDLLGDQDTVTYDTGGYNVYPMYTGDRPRDLEKPVWRAQQSIRLTSLDPAALLDLAGELQALGFSMSNLYYNLSREKYQEAYDALMATALAGLEQRALATAEILGKSSASLIEVTMNDSMNFRPYDAISVSGSRMRMEAMDSMAPPSADPGKTQISVSVSARALVSP